MSHLIIGGATRAGTTSLFIHLSDYPELRGASHKEKRLFQVEGYPLLPKFRYKQNIDRYEGFIKYRRGEHVRLAAAPDENG